jgi:hypothetical protein
MCCLDHDVSAASVLSLLCFATPILLVLTQSLFVLLLSSSYPGYPVKAVMSLMPRLCESNHRDWQGRTRPGPEIRVDGDPLLNGALPFHTLAVIPIDMHRGFLSHSNGFAAEVARLRFWIMPMCLGRSLHCVGVCRLVSPSGL